MSTDRDNSDERPTRVDQMIDEFRTAQLRRLATATTVKGDDQVVESQRADVVKATVAGSNPTRPSH
jgi:hypothetical protein